MRQVLAPPLEVNPLIKLARWVFLFTGIFYGVTRHKTLSILEITRREEREKERVIREEHLARERAIANAATMAELELLFLGPPVQVDKHDKK